MVCDYDIETLFVYLCREEAGEEVLELPRQMDNNTHPNELLMHPSVIRIRYIWKHVNVDMVR